MLKKLTDEKLTEILETGISEFATHGLFATSMSEVAKKAGISVGVLYKYYADKDAFFEACLKRSLSVMEETVTALTSGEDKLINYADALICAVQKYSRTHADYVKMYHEVTVNGDEKSASNLASKIEGMTSRLYSEIVLRAQKEGYIRKDADPRLFAFFFDSLMMMTQFTYCCPYYSERYKLYTGRNIGEDDDFVKEQLLRFLESAFTFEQKDIVHTKS